MKKSKKCMEKIGYSKTATLLWLLGACLLILMVKTSYAEITDSGYEKWKMVGKRSGEEALALMKQRGTVLKKKDLVALTNAGYAEVNGTSTQGALDGFGSATGVSRGRNTLVEIHQGPWIPLWFAVYDRRSGLCAYLQMDPSDIRKGSEISVIPLSELFSIVVLERINAEYLYEHAAAFEKKLARKVFGGNEFRIVAIANAIGEGAPPYAVRVFEFHDHFCPGVSSGILMSNYLKKHFPPEPGGRYFIHAVEPWCKEDALLVLLNATPGKRCYAAYHPTKADKERLVPSAKNASAIVYRKNKAAKTWEGLVLAFEWPETGCPKSKSWFIDKLCEDLWYLKRLEKPEDFVKVVKAFKLSKGVSPKDWARPGIDPLKKLGLLKE